MKKTKKVRSGWPVYSIAVVAVVAVFLFHIHTWVEWLVTAVIAVGVYLASRTFFPDEEVEEKKRSTKPLSREDAELTALRKERDRAVQEMRRLNDNIPDELLSSQIDRIEHTTAAIFDYVMEHPEKKQQIRRFMDYYLPTTLKLLNEYDRMQGVSISGGNIERSRESIQKMLETACSAYEKQLDALYADTAMDINAEVSVLQSMMRQEGLTSSDF